MYSSRHHVLRFFAVCALLLLHILMPAEAVWVTYIEHVSHMDIFIWSIIKALTEEQMQQAANGLRTMCQSKFKVDDGIFISWCYAYLLHFHQQITRANYRTCGRHQNRPISQRGRAQMLRELCSGNDADQQAGHHQLRRLIEDDQLDAAREAARGLDARPDYVQRWDRRHQCQVRCFVYGAAMLPVEHTDLHISLEQNVLEVDVRNIFI